jgi:uroporphyrinogen III methyltransferase/synthase
MSDVVPRPIVVVTREEVTDDRLSRGLAERGAEPVALQTVATAPPEDPSALVAAVEDLATYDWIVFTSARAVDAVCTQPAWSAFMRFVVPGHEVPGLHGTKIAAVGARTAARLASRGVKADVVPAVAGAEALVAALQREAAHRLTGARVLWPRSAIAAPLVAEALSAAGATVDSPVAYRTEFVRPAGIETFLRDLEVHGIAAVAFLSPSSARGLAAALPGNDLTALNGRTLVASLGPSTSAALRELGATPDVEPAARSADALAEAICIALASARSFEA